MNFTLTQKMPILVISSIETALHLLLLTLLGAVLYILQKGAKTKMISTKARFIHAQLKRKEVRWREGWGIGGGEASGARDDERWFTHNI